VASLLRFRPAGARRARLRQLPIEERKAGPPRDDVAGDVIRFSDHVIGRGAAFFAAAARLGVEGMVSKKLGASYRPGRSSNFLKRKCLLRQEFVVGGFTEPERSRVGVGALLIGYYDSRELRWARKAGTGQARTVGFPARSARAPRYADDDRVAFHPAGR